MDNIPNNLIEKWMYLIFQDNKDCNIIHNYKFKEIINLKLSPIITPEHIFLLLISKRYIKTDIDNLREYKESLQSGLIPSLNGFTFNLTDRGAVVLCGIRGEKLLVSINNQLKLDI